MPGKRITDLTALSGANSANNDDLVIFDATASETKRISRSQLAEGMQADVQVLSNKTLALGSNTVTGTTAQFNTALTDGDFATLAGSEVLTNKTINARTNTLQGSDASRLHWFKDVAALLADTTLVAATGDVVQTREEGFAYEVVTSGQHVTTAGGVKLIVLPGDAGMNVKAFGAKGDGTTNDTTAIQLALNAARNLVLQTATNIADQNFPNKGGLTVYVPAGQYIISQIEVPETVSLVGAGKTSTLFTSTFNGSIIRNKVVSGDGTYDKAGIYMADFAVQGDRTKANQTGIDTLRLFDCKMENITIYKCGKHGLHIRQAITSSFNNVTASNNVGAGIVLDEGIDFWATGVANSLPANANTILNCHGFNNDAAGLLIQGRANGNIVLGGSYESNYLASGNNIGFNIEVTATTFSRNLLDGVWTEGAVQAHIYINHATTGSSTDITDWKHFGNGSSGFVDRALICDRGTVSIRNAFGQADSYKSISGSTRPFRMDVAGGDAVVTIINAVGSLITNGQFLEDGSGNVVTSTYQENQGQPISGVNFTNTAASTNVNILDDYLEGVWTPTLATDGTNFVSVTYDAITGGRYTKIGNVVYVQGSIRTDAVDKTGASGFVVVGGLPFTSVGNSPSTNDGYAAGAISTTSAFVTNQPCAGLIFNGSTRMHLLTRAASNGATSFMAVSDVGTGANANALQFSATYIAAV